MSKDKRFLLVGNGPYGNKGCEAIVRGTTAILRRYWPSATFVVSSFGQAALLDASAETDPSIEHRPDGVRLPRFSAAWWKNRLLYPTARAKRDRYVQFEAMRECDCALETGGDNYSLDYDSPSLFVELDRVLMSRGKPLVLWGASVGPFSASPEVERMMAAHLRKLDLILARETETVAYLASIGVEDNVRLVADPAFAMTPRQPDLTEDLLAFLGRNPIGLSLGGPMVDAEGQATALVRECISQLEAGGVGPVLLVPHVVGCSAPDDYEFMQGAASSLPGWGDTVMCLPPNLPTDQTKWVISRLRAHASVRMHSAIAALSSCVPTILIGYSMKSRGVAKDIFGHTDWVLPVDQVSPATLLAKFQTLMAQEQEVRALLRSRIPEITDLAYSSGEHLARILQ